MLSLVPPLPGPRRLFLGHVSSMNLGYAYGTAPFSFSGFAFLVEKLLFRLPMGGLSAQELRY